MHHIDNQTLERLSAAAKAASEKAYAPYSNFHVGAAILTDTGTIYTGCNVENASYGLTSCAERNAVFTMIHAGEQRIVAVAVYTPTATPTAPCGACRQVINEFGTQAHFYSTCSSEEKLSTTLPELLPHSFGPDNLRKPV
jgi:cytidine deaminase